MESVRRTFPLFVIFLIVHHSTGNVLGTCSNLCQNIATSPLLDWYEEGKVYTYEFTTKQATVIKTVLRSIGFDGTTVGNDSDMQNLTISGKVQLQKGSGDMGCTWAAFNIKDAKAVFQKVNTSSTVTRSIYIEGPTMFSGMGHSICAPTGESGWKTNFRRSLVFLLSPSADKYNELKSQTSKWSMTQAYDEADVFGKGGVTNYALWKQGDPTLSKIRVVPHFSELEASLHSIASEVKLQYTSNSTLSAKVDGNTIEQNHQDLIQNYADRLSKYDEFSISSCIQRRTTGAQVTTADCTEIQHTVPMSYLATQVISETHLSLMGTASSSGAIWNPSNVAMTRVSPEYDHSISAIVSEPQLKSDFESLLSKLCSNVYGTQDLMEFGKVFRRVLLITPRSMLESKYAELKRDGCKNGAQGKKAFIDFVALTPTDETVEFLVNLISKNEVEDDTFKTFVWAAALIPTIENDPFQRYAGARAVAAMSTLLNTSDLWHRKYGYSDKEFVLHMLGFRNKIRTDLVDGESSYMVKLLQFAGFSGFEKSIDISTYREVLRSSAETSKDTDTCEDEDAKDDWERLGCHNPCDPRHKAFLTELMTSQQNEDDLKVAAYLHMRKCYIAEWRQIVRNYFFDDSDSISKRNVKNFIVQHIEAISESRKSLDIQEDSDILESNPEIYPSSPSGITQSRTMKERLNIRPVYGLDSSEEAESSYELNLVRDSMGIPRLFTLDFMSFAHGRTQQKYFIQALRLVDSGMRSDILITIKYNGVTLYTNTLTLNLETLLSNENAIPKVIECAVAWIQNVLKHTIFDHKIDVLRNYLSFDVSDQYHTISGLPLKTNAFMGTIFNWQQTKNAVVRSPNGDLNYTLSTNPSLTLQFTEQTSLGLETDEILGYELSSSVRMEFNFLIGVRVIKGENGDYNLLTTFGFDKGVRGHDFYFEIEILKLNRVQYLDHFSNVDKSEHVWAPLEGPSDIETMTEWDPILTGQKCQYYSVNPGIYFSPAPMHLHVIMDCQIPNVYLDVSQERKVDHFSIDIKLHGDDVSQYYQLNMTAEPRKLYGRVATPNVDYELAADVVRESQENSLKFHVSKDGNPKFGLDLYGRKWGASGGIKLDWGLIIWSPLEQFKNMSILVGEINVGESNLKLNDKNVTRSLFLETSGVSPFLDFTLNDTTTIATNIKDQGVFDMTANYDSYFTFKHYFYAVHTWNHGVADRTGVQGNYEVTYGSREMHKISVDYEGGINQNPGKDNELSGNEWEPASPVIVKLNVSSSQFPQQDFTLFSKTIYTTGSKSTYCPKSRLLFELMITPKVSKKPLTLQFTKLKDFDKDEKVQENECHKLYTTLSGSLVLSEFSTATANCEYSYLSSLAIRSLGGSFDVGSDGASFKYDNGQSSAKVVALSAKFYQKSPYAMFSMGHQFVKISPLVTAYNGSVSLYPLEVDFKINGNITKSSPYTMIPNGVDFEITDTNNDHTFILQLNPSKDAKSQVSYKLSLKDNMMSYFVSSIKLLKEKSPEGYFVKIKSSVPSFLNSWINVGPEVFHWEADYDDTKLQGKLWWGRDNNYFLNYKGQSEQISKPNQITGSIISINEFKKIKVSDSLRQIFKKLDPLNSATPFNFILTSTTNATYYGRSSDLELTIQPLPHIDFDYITLRLTYQPFVGERFILDQSGRYAYNKDNNDTKSVILLSKWITCCNESKDVPLKMNWTVVLTDSDTTWKKNALNVETRSVEKALVQYADFRHRKSSIIPGLDIDFKSKSLASLLVSLSRGSSNGFNYPEIFAQKTSKTIQLNAEANGECGFSPIEVFAKHNLYFGPDTLEESVSFKKSGDKMAGQGIDVHFDKNNVRRQLNMKFDSLSEHEPSLVKNVSFSHSGVEGFLRTDPGNGARTYGTNITWSWEVKNKDGKIASRIVGDHQMRRFFEAFSNFQTNVTHNIVVDAEPYNWKDSVHYESTPKVEELKVESSKLFSAKVNMDREKKILNGTIEMLPDHSVTTCEYSRYNQTYNKLTCTAPFLTDPFELSIKSCSLF